jgi:hypothetical protein
VTQCFDRKAVNGPKNGRSPQFRDCRSLNTTSQYLPAQKVCGGSGLTVGRLGRRNRAGAGAGATPVSVAASRHRTSLARRSSLVGLSRPCPSSLISSPKEIRIEKQIITNE